MGGQMPWEKYRQRRIDIMAKTNQKCVRLSDRVAKYIENYRGENFSQKLENYVLDTEERRERLVLDWERLSAEIQDKRQELGQLKNKIQKVSETDRRFHGLVTALLELVDL